MDCSVATLLAMTEGFRRSDESIGLADGAAPARPPLADAGGPALLKKGCAFPSSSTPMHAFDVDVPGRIGAPRVRGDRGLVSSTPGWALMH